jgi:hypothetical protein
VVGGRRSAFFGRVAQSGWLFVLACMVVVVVDMIYELCEMCESGTVEHGGGLN